jgi:RNA polymerase sigma-70 factor (ECF subfamily)
VLAFAERKLVGLLALTIVNRSITKIHVLVGASTLGPLRAELAGTR